MLTIGSLFSGIGGLELGLEMAGLGPTLWQVEREPFCRAVLAHHWPKAERFDDVRSVGRANLAPVELICGGFPCQDVSSAGKGAGLAGERSGLWREFARVVGELRPRWVVVENVKSGAGRWLDAVVRELEKLGYAALPVPISAGDVGAPHRRERIFIVANADDQSSALQQAPGCGVPGTFADANGGELWFIEQRLAEGRATRGVRNEGQAQPGEHGATGDAADAHDPRREGPGLGGGVKGWKGLAPHPGWSPQSDLVPLVYGLSGGMAGRRRRARIRALGNSVVPQCAEVVGWVIRELLAGRAA